MFVRYRPSNINKENLPKFHVRSQAWLDWPSFQQADLRGADLSYLNLTNMELDGVNLAGAHIIDADLENANLAGAVLVGAEMDGADLSFSNLTGADLSYANLSFAIMEGVTLIDANLTGAILNNANMTNADMSGAYLKGAEMSGTVLTGAVLTGTGLTEAILIVDGYLEEVYFQPDTREWFIIRQMDSGPVVVPISFDEALIKMKAAGILPKNYGEIEIDILDEKGGIVIEDQHSNIAFGHIEPIESLWLKDDLTEAEWTSIDHAPDQAQFDAVVAAWHSVFGY